MGPQGSAGVGFCAMKYIITITTADEKNLLYLLPIIAILVTTPDGCVFGILASVFRLADNLFVSIIVSLVICGCLWAFGNAFYRILK